MKKNVQRINESQLRAIVVESVKKVLNENGIWDTLESDLSVAEVISMLQKYDADARVCFYNKDRNEVMPVKAMYLHECPESDSGEALKDIVLCASRNDTL